MRTARQLIVEGRVQGVGYRAWAVEVATMLRVDGSIRNKADGSVEVVVAGSPERVRAFTDRCRRGPVLARVERLKEMDMDAEAVAPGFRQLSTD